MPDTIPEDSIGIVTPQTIHFDAPLALVCGRTLEQYELIYETYGELNADKSNAILICHALSSDHHAAGYHSMEDRKPGWWEACIGPGKVIDTNHFHVVSLNNLGGCKGSSGPTSLDPATGKAYGPDFPIVTVKDWVKSQALLADRLGIDTWQAVIGGSLGGMQVLQWAIDYPERIKNAAVIASASKLTAQNIGFNEVARQAIMTDPEFHAGRYSEHGVVPRRGLMLARMLGHITYLSDDAMRDKFGRELREGRINYGFDVEFQVESYLRYQGQSFVDRFDANTHLLMTKALDYFDPAADFDNDLSKALSHARSNFLVISFSSDWRFASERSREIVRALRNNNHNVSYADIVASHGHDAFLLPIQDYLDVFGAWMSQLVKEVSV